MTVGSITQLTDAMYCIACQDKTARIKQLEREKAVLLKRSDVYEEALVNLVGSVCPDPLPECSDFTNCETCWKAHIERKAAE